MRIGIDASMLQGEKSGVATYTEELTLALARVFPHDEFLWFSHRAVESRDGLPANIHVEQPARVPNRTLWMQFTLHDLARERGLNLFHFSNSLAPLRFTIPYVISLHDMSTRLLPNSHTWKKRILWRVLLPHSVIRSRSILVGSESAAADIRTVFPRASEKIFVTPYAASPDFHPAAPSEDFDRALRALGVQRPFILSVGNLEPRKDLETLLRTFKRLRDHCGVSHQLYLCGPRGWKNRALKALLHADGGSGVRHLGFLPREQLRALYCSADLLVYPSVMEGFGLPVLEAMACGTVVVAAASSAVREIGGSAVRLFPVGSATELERTLVELLQFPAEREKLRRACLAHAAQFTWNQTAARTMEIYRQASQSP